MLSRNRVSFGDILEKTTLRMEDFPLLFHRDINSIGDFCGFLNEPSQSHQQDFGTLDLSRGRHQKYNSIKEVDGYPQTIYSFHDNLCVIFVIILHG